MILALVLTLAIFGMPVVASLKLIAEGAFGDLPGLSRTVVKTTPLLLCGLGILLAWRAGVFNIGGEGQFLVGASAGAASAMFFGSLPGGVLNPIILLSAMLGGGAYAAFAGWLQVKRGVPAVISTILMNFIALYFLDWGVNGGPLQRADRTLPQSEPLGESVMLLRFSRQLDAHTGTVYALLAVAAVWVYLFYTKGGFQLRLVGENARAARANRIPSDRVAVWAMFLSGALCGLAGAIEYTGITGLVTSKGFAQGWGFLAIPVALLGNLHPLGVLLSALYFGALFAGSENLARFQTGADKLILFIQGAAVLALIGMRMLVKAPSTGFDPIAEDDRPETRNPIPDTQ
jgi:general nucleoside transport system permease protein